MSVYPSPPGSKLPGRPKSTTTAQKRHDIQHSFQLFQDGQAPTSKVPKLWVPQAPTVHSNSASDECLALAKKWLDDCQHEHAECRTSSSAKLPHRVIDITAKEPCLYIPSLGMEGQWVALSHCWGHTNTYKTTLQTLESRKRGLEWDNLPKTCQDAIRVTRALGLQYLWIDSLCIIQDDEQAICFSLSLEDPPIEPSGADFHTESAKMCDIYRNSTLTISAACSSSDCLGFLQERTLSWRLQGSGLESLRLRQEIDHHELLLVGPIHTRAWTFQELILPRCLLSFTSKEMTWECETLRTCECSYITGDGDHGASIDEIGRTAYRKYTGTVIEGRYYIGKESDVPIFAMYSHAFGANATEPELQRIISGVVPEYTDPIYDEWAGEAQENQLSIQAFYRYWRETLVPEYTRRSSQRVGTNSSLFRL